MEIEAQAHDAMGDVMILEETFNRLLKKMIDETGDEDSAINKMIEVSSHPSLLHTISFGKYNGQKNKRYRQHRSCVSRMVATRKIEE